MVDDGLDPRKHKIGTGIIPAAAWQERAGVFCDWAHEQLLGDEERLQLLYDRGIRPETIKQYCLGVNPENFFRPRESWGLATEFNRKGTAKKLWIPPGLVIPYIVGRVCRIRINHKPGEWYTVPGSTEEPMMLGGKQVYLIIKAELDGILVDQEAGDIVNVIALGSYIAKPTLGLYVVLKEAESLLVALDSDGEPGAQAARWWLRNFKQAKRWPVPEGCNPTVSYEAGVDLRQWVLAGLPPVQTMGPLLEKETILKEQIKTKDEQAAIKTKADHPDSVKRLYELLKKSGVRIIKSSGSIRLQENDDWIKNYKEESKELSQLVFCDDACWQLVNRHDETIIDKNNLFKETGHVRQD